LRNAARTAAHTPEHRYGISDVIGSINVQPSFLALYDNYNVAMVDGGESHALALLSNGSVVAWTNGGPDANKYGQATVPPFPAGRTAVQVAAGASFSVVLLDNGYLMVWGDSSFGQAFVPRSLMRVKVTAVAAGQWHVLAVLENGTVAGFGRSDWGQLNIPEELLASGANVVQVAGGAYHSMARTVDGRVFAWGDDEYSQVAIPSIVQAGGVLHIAAGEVCSFALLAGPAWGNSDGNKLVFWGRDDGQSAAQNLSGVVDIASGRWHVATLQNTGIVLAWGMTGNTVQDADEVKHLLLCSAVVPCCACLHIGVQLHHINTTLQYRNKR
jgi:alpha-tubulin suppressor-like RCC1 family protein